MYTDADMDMLESGSDSDDGDRDDQGDLSSDAEGSEDDQGRGFVAAFAEVSFSVVIIVGYGWEWILYFALIEPHRFVILGTAP